MLYKTIVLELLKERSELHERLRTQRRLLPTIHNLALQMQASHREWLTMLATPGSEKASTEAQEMAMHMAMMDIRATLLLESNSSEADESAWEDQFAPASPTSHLLH
jgi:hypothetical protein